MVVGSCSVFVVVDGTVEPILLLVHVNDSSTLYSVSDIYILNL